MLQQLQQKHAHLSDMADLLRDALRVIGRDDVIARCMTDRQQVPEDGDRRHRAINTLIQRNVFRLVLLLARTVCNADRRTPSSNLPRHLHWFPVRRWIEYKTATLYFKSVKLGIPSYLTNMLKPHEPTRTLKIDNRESRSKSVGTFDVNLAIRDAGIEHPFSVVNGRRLPLHRIAWFR